MHISTFYAGVRNQGAGSAECAAVRVGLTILRGLEIRPEQRLSTEAYARRTLCQVLGPGCLRPCLLVLGLDVSVRSAGVRPVKLQAAGRPAASARLPPSLNPAVLQQPCLVLRPTSWVSCSPVSSASGPLAAGRKSHRRPATVEYALPRALAEAGPVTAVLAIRPDSTHVLHVLGRVGPCVRTVRCSETRPTGDTDGTTVLGAVLPQSLCHRPGRGPDRCGVRRPQTTPQTCPRRGMVRIVASRPGGQSRGLCSCPHAHVPMPDA